MELAAKVAAGIQPLDINIVEQGDTARIQFVNATCSTAFLFGVQFSALCLKKEGKE